MSFLVRNRLVWTYRKGERNLGVITGYEYGEGMVIEHVITMGGTAILGPMLKAGLQQARDYEHLILCLPNGSGKIPTLERVARKVGFAPYSREKDLTWFIRYR